ncbi:hypothetical protein CEXT_150881 [Caerostris extrusa]|uniref:Uncharacterized protein n=1 Tax=Caerostris extrusa TaxID=172846 RepID=A0AAV4PHT0_CAEEX|nr:hypothetical protein CEXT_150881 [Caerostris extrusa]
MKVANILQLIKFSLLFQDDISNWKTSSYKFQSCSCSCNVVGVAADNLVRSSTYSENKILVQKLVSTFSVETEDITLNEAGNHPSASPVLMWSWDVSAFVFVIWFRLVVLAPRFITCKN